MHNLVSAIHVSWLVETELEALARTALVVAAWGVGNEAMAVRGQPPDASREVRA